jgi:hypothetical protein
MPQATHRPDLLEQPAFWAAHMWNITRGPIAENDPEAADAAFGIWPNTIQDFCVQELFNEQQWPYFSVSLRSGFSVQVEYSNFPEDYEIIYRVCHKDWASSISVGKGGGHWQLPAFRWAELLEIGQAAARPASAMLLLLPSVWITRDDNMAEIRRQLIETWQNLNLVPRSKVMLLVEQLITSSQSDVQWRVQERLGWVNDGDNSRRNPDSPACLNAQEFSALQAFFNSMST